MNKVILIGYLGSQELKIMETNTGTKILSFSLGIPKKTKGETKWNNIYCTAFNQTAELIKRYCSPRDRVCVGGSLDVQDYLKDGETRYTTKVLVNEVEFLQSKKEHKSEPVIDNDLDDEIPF